MLPKNSRTNTNGSRLTDWVHVVQVVHKVSLSQVNRQLHRPITGFVYLIQMCDHNSSVKTGVTLTSSLPDPHTKITSSVHTFADDVLLITYL